MSPPEPGCCLHCLTLRSPPGLSLSSSSTSAGDTKALVCVRVYQESVCESGYEYSEAGINVSNTSGICQGFQIESFQLLMHFQHTQAHLCVLGVHLVWWCCSWYLLLSALSLLYKI